MHARIGHNEPNQPLSVYTIDNKPYILVERRAPESRSRVARLIFIWRKSVRETKFLDGASRPKKSHQLSPPSQQQSVSNRAIRSSGFQRYLRSVKKQSIRSGTLQRYFLLLFRQTRSIHLCQLNSLFRWRKLFHWTTPDATVV